MDKHVWKAWGNLLTVMLHKTMQSFGCRDLCYLTVWCGLLNVGPHKPHQHPCIFKLSIFKECFAKNIWAPWNTNQDSTSNSRIPSSRNPTPVWWLIQFVQQNSMWNSQLKSLGLDQTWRPPWWCPFQHSMRVFLDLHILIALCHYDFRNVSIHIVILLSWHDFINASE